MSIESIKGCMGWGTCIETCPTDVIRKNPKTGEAFTTIITTWDSEGIILGMIAWGLMLILGLTSIMRTESRCSHYRLDYPEVDDENWRAWINIFKGTDSSMQLEKQASDSWPEQKRS